MTDEEMVQRFVAGESIVRITEEWHDMFFFCEGEDAEGFFCKNADGSGPHYAETREYVEAVVRARLAAELTRNKGGRPRKWASDKERVAAAVKTYRAKKKAQKLSLPS